MLTRSGESSAELPKGGGRLDYLDNLRVSLTILVICHHCNAAYGSIGGWVYIVRERGGALSELLATMFAGVTQAFFMSSFFLISAYFTAPGIDEKGGWRYARRRLVRLGIPILAHSYVLSLLLRYMVRQFQGRTELGLVDYFRANFLNAADPGPLWFTSALLIFESVYLACRFAPLLRDRPPRVYPLPGDRQILVFVLGIGVFTFFFRQWFPPSYHLWHFNLAYFPLYVCMFTVGIVARRSGWFETLGAAQAGRWYRVALAAIALAPPALVLNVVLGYDEYAFWGGFNWQAFAYAMWEPLLCVGINMKLIVLYRDRVNGSSRLARNLARSSYTAYIFHAFFIVVATYLFTFFSLGRIPEIILMWPVAVIPCFLFADALRRAPLLNRIL